MSRKKLVGDPTSAPQRPSAAVMLRRCHCSAPSTVRRGLSAAAHRMYHRPSGPFSYCQNPADRRNAPPRRQKHRDFPAWRRPLLPLWRGQQWGRHSAGDLEKHLCTCRCHGPVLPVPRRLPPQMPTQSRGTAQPFPSGAGQPSGIPYCYWHFPAHVHITTKPSPLLQHFM